MTPQLAFVIYKSTLKIARKERIKLKGSQIVHRSPARWDETLQECVQDVWAWSKIKQLAYQYKDRSK